jgi:hypothetical protein
MTHIYFLKLWIQTHFVCVEYLEDAEEFFVDDSEGFSLLTRET